MPGLLDAVTTQPVRVVLPTVDGGFQLCMVRLIIDTTEELNPNERFTLFETSVGYQLFGVTECEEEAVDYSDRLPKLPPFNWNN